MIAPRLGTVQYSIFPEYLSAQRVKENLAKLDINIIDKWTRLERRFFDTKQCSQKSTGDCCTYDCPVRYAASFSQNSVRTFTVSRLFQPFIAEKNMLLSKKHCIMCNLSWILLQRLIPFIFYHSKCNISMCAAQV